MSQSLVFIDAAVEDKQSLIKGIDIQSKVFILDSDNSGIEQINDILKSHSQISAIHIVSHGKSSGLKLGNSWLTRSQLQSHDSQFEIWQSALTEDADILLYGCDVAQGEEGIAFVEQLSQLTGANVAASNNLTGSAAAGADWNLEVTTGLIKSPLAFSKALQSAYTSVLMAPSNIAPIISLPGGSISYTENSAATVLDLGATVTDIDSPNFNTGNLTVRFTSGGTADDRLSIRNQGIGGTEINLDGREIYYGSTKIGNFSGGIGTESLVINLNSAATEAATQALVRNITFANTSQNPATTTRTIEIVLTDDTGSKSTSVTKTVQVTAVNDAPSFGTTLVLYDGSTGKKPEESGAAPNAPWFASQNIPANLASTSATGGVTNLVTSNTTYAGYTNYGITYPAGIPSLSANPLNNLFPTLDRNAGFVVSFRLQVNSQTLAASADKNSDSKPDRAGFSVIALDKDKKGIELGFLTNRIFAQDDGTTQINPGLEPDTSANPYKTLFTQAEGVDVNTTTTVVNYDLAVLGDYYTLFADGAAKLTGRVRDYTAAATPFPIPDVYEKPNFLFLGDDTPSAGTNSNLAFVKVTTSGDILNQTINQDTATDAIPFSIGDSETAASNLTVTASSSNPDLIPNKGIVISGTGSDRTVKVTPAATKYGEATISLNVSDGDKITTRKFVVNVNNINDNPTDLALDKTDVKDKAPANTVIGTFSSTDPDENDHFTYNLVLGIDDTDNNAFTIDGNTLKIKDSPDFKTKSSYKIRVRTTDNGGLTFDKLLTINVDQIPTRLTKPSDDVFKITCQDVKTTLQIQLTGNSSKLVNELALFTVDDDKGTINGIAPGAEGYAKAALDRSEVILSAIANTPNGFQPNNLSRLLELNSGENFRFLLVQDGSLDSVRNNPNSIGKLLFSSVSTQKITDLGDNSFSLAWNSASGKSSTDFNDLVVKITQTNQPLPLGTNLQGQFQGQVIDLRDVKQSVKAEFNVYREASYNDYVGFYQVTDVQGGIDTNGDGKADILTGQAGYTQAAVRSRVAGIDLSVSNQGSATYSGTFQPGAIFVPFIIVNARPDAVLNNNSNAPAVYFPFLGANSDQSDHIRLLESNAFGFEDLSGGGDKDFNDVIIKVNLRTIN